MKQQLKTPRKLKRLVNVPNLATEDYYFGEQNLMVFTETYHLKRGYCCKSACRHCPYGFKKQNF